MSADMAMFLIGLVFVMCASTCSAGNVTFGNVCSSTTDCDTTKGLHCLMISGGKCTQHGICYCSPSKTWLLSSANSQILTCKTAIGVGDTCKNSTDCINVRNLDPTAAGVGGICVNGRCSCPANSYTTPSSKFFCLNAVGKVPRGGNCLKTSDCSRNLWCRSCPGLESQLPVCLGVTGSGSSAIGMEIWLMVVSMVSVMLFFKEK